MSFNIVTLPTFEKELKKLAKKYVSIKTDFQILLSELEKNPNAGISLGKNCYKVRMAIASKGKGKSGGARVITHLIFGVENETLYLLKIYDKNEQQNITDAELKTLLQLIK